MYNLLRFFLRYYLLFLFVVLEALCFILIYTGNKYNQAAYTNAAAGVSGRVYATIAGVSDYLHLRSVNDSLAMENASLRAQLMESKYDNGTDSVRARDTIGKFVQVYSYIPARVIRNSLNQATNIIYLEKGKLQGVEKQMGVISPTGIVGQVVNVTDNYAVVMSVLSKDFKVSARFKKNDYFGNVHWDGINSTSATLEEIPKHVPAKVGDTIVTSGFSQLFPRSVMIGVVEKVESAPEKTFLDITVHLSTGFGNLSYVYVVNSLRKEELNQLDSTSVVK